QRNVVRDMLWPQDPGHRLVVLAFLIPLLLPALAAPLVGGKPVSLWALAGVITLPVIVLAPAQLALTREAALRILGFAVALPLLAIAAPPPVPFIIPPFAPHPHSPPSL